MSSERCEVGIDLQTRLRSSFIQLQTESGILDRIVHKGKNQHRRCSYFKYLLKVRRDVKLLLSCRLHDVLTNSFFIIDGKKPLQKFHMLERLKKKYDTGHNDHERILGIARLLSQMLEPIIMTYVRTSSLLARSFFLSYSLIVLALLSRIRVLIQQMLLDVVAVYNLVTDISLEKHSIEITKNGVQAFREYYPPLCKEFIYLECVWEEGKFVLHETAMSKKKDCNTEVIPMMEVGMEVPTILYETIEVSVEDQGVHSDSGNAAYLDVETEQLNVNDENHSPKIECIKRSLPKIDVTSWNQSNSDKVAFIQVGKSGNEEGRSNKRLKLGQVNLKDEEESSSESLFKLLTAGIPKS